MFHLYCAVLIERRSSPALSQGEIRVGPSPKGILAYERRAGDDLRQVLVSFADRELDVPLEHGWTASVRSAGEAPWDGRLQPYEAVVLRPR
jgi:hypothetical protein